MPEEEFCRAQTTQVGQPWKHSLISVLKWGDSRSSPSGKGRREPSLRQLPLQASWELPMILSYLFIFHCFLVLDVRRPRCYLGNLLSVNHVIYKAISSLQCLLLGFSWTLGENWSQLSSLENTSTLGKNTHSGTPKKKWLLIMWKSWCTLGNL